MQWSLLSSGSMSVSFRTPSHVSLADLQRLLPANPLYGERHSLGDGTGIGWMLSPVPYEIDSSRLAMLERLGLSLYQFSKAIDRLYKTSLKDPDLHWIQSLFQAGKPQQLVNFAQMGRLKQHLPLVIRPDLLVTERGLALCEIDAVPGGIGFTASLSQAYQSLGFQLVGAPEGIPHAFLTMLLESAPDFGLEDPFIGLVVSDESSDYRSEMDWLVESIQQIYPRIALLHPKRIRLEHNRLGFMDESNHFQAIQILYRFFELFDLPNIPQIELIQYAIKKGLLFCTPPFKPHLEEKFVLALIHDPFLEPFWLETLGEAHYQLLKTLVPEGWILNPEPVPAHASIVPELRFAGQWFRDFSRLGTLTQKQRELVIKPSGFSPMAWGSRGIKIGHDLSQVAWQQALQEAFSQFHTTPWLMQRFQNPEVEPYSYFDSASGEIRTGEGRTRLCPYYFVSNDSVRLAGILATTCPKDKKIIHGMKDGVMRPLCSVS